MARESVIEVEGTVVQPLPKKMYQVELANGHRLLGYLPKRAVLGLAGLTSGDRVRLEMSPYDLSVGRITGQAQTS